MSRRTALLLLVALVAVAGAAVLVATRVDPSHITGTVDPDHLPVEASSVPALGAATGWVNSKPLSSKDLQGRVVVYDFWTYSCVNCVRTLPHLEAWYDRYKSDGLIVVGVHSPEFDFEKDPANVERATEELKLTYPVALDPDHDIWNAFDNQYWPEKYVTDRQGRLRYVHIGEGGYSETEDVLRALLGVAKDSPRAGKAVGGGPENVPDKPQTPETYLGTLRGTTASPQGSLAEGTRDFTVPTDLPVDKFAFDGTWDLEGEYARSAAPGAAIVLHYRGTEVNLVMSAATPVDVELTLDGKQVPASNRPADVKDTGGTTSVTVQPADLYRLVVHGPAGDHTLRLEAGAAGLQAFAFTFGSS